jgi:hypothetical protein
MSNASEYKRNRLVSEAAAEMRMSAETILRALRGGAPHDRLGKRTVRVSIEELRAWMAEREAARASNKGAA